MEHGAGSGRPQVGELGFTGFGQSDSRGTMSAVSTSTLHARADQAAAVGDFAAALGASAEVLRAMPEDHRARLKVGLCLAMLGKNDEAIATLKVVAEGLAHRGFMLAAIGACRDALGLAPDEPSIVETLRGIHARIREQEGPSRARVPPPIPPLTIDDPSADGLFTQPLEELLPAAVELGTRPFVSDAPAPPSHVPLFSELSIDAFVSLVSKLGYLKVPADHQIVREGNAGTSVYILLEGEARVSRHADGGPIELARLSGGALFGEMAMITEKPRQATVVTTQPSELFEVDKATLADVANDHPQVTEEIVKFARRRLLYNVMATSPLFQPLDRSQRVDILKQFEPVVVDAGAVVVSDGQPSKGLFVVVEGEVEVSKVDDGGDRVVLAYLKAGDVFGEISLVEEKPATADVRVADKSVLLCLEHARFKTFTDAHPEILAVLQELSGARRAELEEAMADGVALDADDLIIV